MGWLNDVDKKELTKFILFVNHFIIYMVKMFFICRLLKRRCSIMRTIGLYALYSLIIAYLSMYPFRDHSLRAIVECGFVLIMLLTLFKDESWKISVVGVSIFFVTVIAEICASFTVVGDYDVVHFLNSGVNTLIRISVLINLYTILIYCIILRPLRNMFVNHSNKNDSLVSLSIITQTVILYFIGYRCWNNTERDPYIGYVYLILLLLSMVVTILIIKSNITKKIDKLQENYVSKHDKHLRQYNAEIIAQYEKLKRFRHDYISQLQTIAGLISKDENAKALEFIESLNVEIKSFPVLVNTGNVAVDSILYYKVVAAKELKIDIKVFVEIPKGLQVSDDDLSKVVSNSLDNAIEGCKDVYYDRYIVVETKEKGGHFSWIVRNSCRYDIRPDLRTTKGDKVNHGLGTNILRSVARKYGGDASFRVFNGEFTCLVYFRSVKVEE